MGIQDQQQRSDFNGGCFAIMIIFGLILTFFLMPSIILIYPFSSGFWDAAITARNSVLAWIWSIVVWGVVFMIFAAAKK